MAYTYTSSNSANNPGACSYNQLGAYTSGYSMGNVPNAGKPTVGSYIVPVWGASGYDSLVGSGSCSSYGSISSAYGGSAGQCNQAYTTSMCGSAPSSQARRM